MINKFRLIKILLFISTLFLSQYLLAKAPIKTYSAKYPVFSRDNSQLVYLSSTSSYMEWAKTTIVKMSTKDGSILKSVPLKLESAIKPFAATPDGFKILATTPKGIAVIHNGTGKTLRTLPYPANNQNRYPKLWQQSGDGVLLAIPQLSPKSRKIDIIHTGSGKLMYTVDLLKGEKWTRYPTIRGIGFSPKRRYIAYVFQASRSSTLHVYDLYKKTEIMRLKITGENRDSLEQGKIQFSKNGNWLIFSGNNLKEIALIDVKKKSLKILKTGYSSFSGFTPDDQNLILVQAYKKRIVVRNIQTGKEYRRPIMFDVKNGTFGAGMNIIQSADRSLLALPITTNDFKNINKFLLINGRNGQLSRQIGR